MANEPWLKYQSAQSAEGPWTKYQSGEPKDDGLPWDVPMTGAQMRREQTNISAADAALKNVEPSEPGLAHLLMSPIVGAMKAGQSALGERPLPTGLEAAGYAAFAVVPPEFAQGAAATAAALGRAVPISRDTMGRVIPAAPAGAPSYDTARQIANTAGKTERAARIVEKRAGQDIASGATTAQEVIDNLAKGRSLGKPVMLPDVLGGNVSGEAGKAARSPGPAKTVMESAFSGRNLGATSRLTGDINRAFGDTGAFDGRAELAQARKTAAAPLYNAAYAHYPINPDWMNPDGAIGSLLSRPSMRAGMANAAKIAAEEGRPMNTLGLGFNEAGDVVFQKVPSWQTLDYVKRGLDDVVEVYRDKVTGRLVLDTYGRAAEETRDLYRNILKDANPSYKAALDSWSGPSQSMEAIKYGEDALRYSPEQNAARLRDFGEGDREFAKIGIAQTLRDMANSKGPLAVEFDRLAGTRYGATATRDKLRPFFDSEGDLNRLVDAVATEIKMARKGNEILSGSQTTSRIAEDTSAVTGEDLTHMGISATLGHPTGVLHRLATMLGRAAIKPDPEVTEHIARILTDPNIGLTLEPGGRLKINSTIQQLGGPP